MTGKAWTPEEDSLLIELDNDGLDAYEIAGRMLSRTRRAILHRREVLKLPKRNLQEIGKLQTARWVREFEARLGESVETWLQRRYVNEGATYRELTKEAGINTRSLMKLMKASDIAPISPNEAIRRQMERDPSLIERMVLAGQKPEAVKKRALSRQANWRTFCSKGELRLLKILNDNGLYPVPQLAVETFNIDFAFPDAMLAVEYDPSWHHSSQKRPTDAKKDATLKALGWTVLRLVARTSDAYNIKRVSDALNALASTHPH